LRFGSEWARQVYQYYGFDSREQREGYDKLAGPVIASLKGNLRDRKIDVPFERVEIWIEWETF
jgi:hypothetical protein